MVAPGCRGHSRPERRLLTATSAALLVYGAVVLAVGVATARRSSGSETAFLLGDRSFGAVATWAALSSTTIGGSTTLVLAALVAARGLPALWLDLAGALGLAALGLFLASRVRETGAVTIGEVIGRFYGPAVRRIAAFLVVLAEIVWFGLLTEATRTVVVAATSWNPDTVLVATAALFVAYTALGGQRAVIGTDLFQFALMVLAILLFAFPLAVSSLIRTGLPRELLRFPVSDRFTWLDAAAFLVLVGLPHAVGSDVWAKLLSARDAHAARLGALGAAASKLAFGIATTSIALAGVSLSLGGAGTALFPKTVLALAGPALSPVVFVAMIATMQSSSDSVLLSAAAATTHDLLPRTVRRAARRPWIVVYGALGLLVALKLHDLLAIFRLGYTLFASSLILPTLLAFVPSVRVPRAAAGAAMILGGAAAMAERFLQVTGLDPVLVGTGVNAAVLLATLRKRT